METSERSWLWINLAAVVVVIAGLRAAQPIAAPFLMAAFLAVISFPVVEWLTKRRAPLVFAVTLVLLVAMLLMVGLGMVVSESIQDFTRNLPNYESQFTQQVEDARAWLQSLGLDVPIPQAEEIVSTSAIFSITGTLVSGLGTLLTNVLLILLSYVFLLLEAKGFPAKLEAAFGKNSTSLDDLQQLARKMKHYLALKALMSIVTALPIWLFLVIMGVDYPVLWGLVAFLMNFIPNIGSVIAAIPPVLLGLIQLGPVSAIMVGGFYVMVNMVVGNVIEPRMMGRGLGLSTFVVFAALVFWGWVLGPVGMFLSVPLTIMAQIILYSHSQTRGVAILLGEDLSEPPEPLPSAADV